MFTGTVGENIAITNPDISGDEIVTAAKIANKEGLENWRTIINTGAEAGQSVFHLHLHIIGGRSLEWPPG